MDTLRQDLRSALRQARRAPGVTAAITLSVVLGIATCTALLCAVWALVLRPLPFREPQGLGIVVAAPAGQPAEEDADSWSMLSLLDAQDLRAQSRSFAAMELYFANYGLTLTDGAPERVKGALVSAGLLPLLGTRPILGRPIRPEEDRWRSESVLLLGYDLWQRRFRGDPGIVGRTIAANGSAYRVAGVMPPGFSFPADNEAWIALGAEVQPLQARTVRRYLPLVRLRPGVSAERAGQEVQEISRRLAAVHPADAGWRMALLPLRSVLLGGDLQHSVLAVLAAVLAVLLIACANISNLLLAEGVKRRREIALRAALGAGRRRLVRQLLTESLLLAVAGGCLGLPLGVAGLRLVRNVLPSLPYSLGLTADLPALAAAAALCLGAGVLFGLAPALRASRPDLAAVFRQPAEGGRRAGRLHAGLIVAEIALAAVLLLAAALALRTLWALRAQEQAILPDRLFTAWVSFSGKRYDDAEARARGLRSLVERIAAVGGVESAAGADFIPLSVVNSSEGRIEAEGGGLKGQAALGSTVTSGFFRTWGAPWVAGRDLTPEEASTWSHAAVVNTSLARRLWPDGRAVGRRLRILGSTLTAEWLTVVGVTGDFKIASLRAEVPPQVFVSAVYNIYRPAGLIVRTRLPPEQALAAVRRAIRGTDPELPLFQIDTMDGLCAAHLRAERLSGGGLALFGSVALFVAAIGTYGVLAVAVERRRREIAVRLALGAPRGPLLRRLIGRGLALALSGLALGLLAGLAVSRALAGQLYGVTAADPVSYAGVAILLLDVAFIACWLPARRALDVEPAEALRQG